MKKKINSKSKGNAWERKSARILSLLLSDGKKTDLFWRTASSGALATVTKKYNTQMGDIQSVNQEYKLNYHVECKCLSKISIFPMSKILKDILDKLSEKERPFILMLKITNKGEYLIMRWADFQENVRELVDLNGRWNATIYKYVVFDISQIDKKESKNV